MLDEGWELLLKPVSPKALLRKARNVLDAYVTILAVLTSRVIIGW
jgi:hypothetical protein